MIEIEKSLTADSGSKASKDTLYKSSVQHRSDVREGLNFFSTKLQVAAMNHDHDKLSGIDEFHIAFASGFSIPEWFENHVRVNRHHLLVDGGVPDDVTLLDVLEMVSDCVMAGMARSGSVYDLEINTEVLSKAFTNTVELLKRNVVVKED